MDKKLTTEILDNLKPGIFACGVTIDDADHCNVAGTGKEIKWVAVRGIIADWAIYIDNPYTPQKSFGMVRDMGDKIHEKKNILSLVDCDEEALERYRH